MEANQQMALYLEDRLQTRLDKVIYPCDDLRVPRRDGETTSTVTVNQREDFGEVEEDPATRAKVLKG